MHMFRVDPGEVRWVQMNPPPRHRCFE